MADNDDDNFFYMLQRFYETLNVVLSRLSSIGLIRKYFSNRREHPEKGAY